MFLLTILIVSKKYILEVRRDPQKQAKSNKIRTLTGFINNYNIILIIVIYIQLRNIYNKVHYYENDYK